MMQRSQIAYLTFFLVAAPAAQRAVAAGVSARPTSHVESHPLRFVPALIEVANLQDQLENGLQARLPGEFAFIARVVEMVEANQLPLELVKSTFQWARRKKPYPFPYFERALRLRAAKLGIQID